MRWPGSIAMTPHDFAFPMDDALALIVIDVVITPGAPTTLSRNSMISGLKNDPAKRADDTI